MHPSAGAAGGRRRLHAAGRRRSVRSAGRLSSLSTGGRRALSGTGRSGASRVCGACRGGGAVLAPRRLLDTNPLCHDGGLAGTDRRPGPGRAALALRGVGLLPFALTLIRLHPRSRSLCSKVRPWGRGRRRLPGGRGGASSIQGDVADLDGRQRGGGVTRGTTEVEDHQRDEADDDQQARANQRNGQSTKQRCHKAHQPSERSRTRRAGVRHTPARKMLAEGSMRSPGTGHRLRVRPGAEGSPDGRALRGDRLRFP